MTCSATLDTLPDVTAGHAQVFVYGTLRRGFPLHTQLPGDAVEYVGDGRIQGRLFDLGEYPGATASGSPRDEVRGEVYRLRDPERQIQALDEIEEFDSQRPDESLFLRRLTDVRLDRGGVVKAWAYFLSREPENAPVIADGDYAHRRATGRSASP